MKFYIKNRFTGSVIFSLETDSFRLCIETAIKHGVDLSGTALSGANLYRANLN